MAAGEHARERDRKLYTLAAIVESSDDAIIGATLGGVVETWNPAAERMYGFPAEDMVGRHISTVVPRDRRPEMERILARIRSGERLHHLRTVRMARDGRRIDVSLTVSPILDDRGVPVGVSAICRDIGGVVRAEARLRESEARYRSLVEQLPAITYVNTVGEKRRLFVSEQILPVLGFSVEEWLADPGIWESQLHPADRDSATAACAATYASGRDFDLEYRMLSRDGRTVWVHDRARIVRNASGEPHCIQGVMLDITDLKHAEEEAALSERRFRAMVEHATDVIVAVDGRGILLYVSPSARELLGWEPEALLGSNAFDLIHPDDLESAGEVFAEVLGDSSVRRILPFRVRHQDGTWRTVEAVGSNLLADPAVGGILINIRDITERKEVERELRTSFDLLQRREAERRQLLRHLIHAEEEERRRVAADIHDDSVQVLAAVALRLGLLRRHLDDGDLAGMLDDLDETVSEAVRRLRQLMFELAPPALERDGLAATIRALVASITAAGGLENRVEDLFAGEPPQEVRAVLYRIVQEA
ncbi:MAG: PAS domain S-box protein, partial [Actinobacteria bacterium]|nr:PAS domain S-box protein [Actinomycetota bacterium]